MKKTQDDDRQIVIERSSNRMSDEFSNLKYGDLIYYKNSNPIDIRQWLPAKFLKKLSTNILQVSLDGRLVSAHKRQLKVVPAPCRKASRTFAFQDESVSLPTMEPLEHPLSIKPPTRSRYKRNREDDYEAFSDVSDVSSDFHGFAADSLIFSGEEAASTRCYQQDNLDDGILRSKRKCKMRKYTDYVYY